MQGGKHFNSVRHVVLWKQTIASQGRLPGGGDWRPEQDLEQGVS